jgi:predicted nucleotidyltransferase
MQEPLAMKPSQLLNTYRSEICRMVEQNHVRNPRVFGSVLHGEDTEGSDLDLLVDPLPGTTLLNLGALQVDLEQLLGVHVDVLTPGDLPPKFRDAVVREALPV